MLVEDLMRDAREKYQRVRVSSMNDHITRSSASIDADDDDWARGTQGRSVGFDNLTWALKLVRVIFLVGISRNRRWNPNKNQFWSLTIHIDRNRLICVENFVRNWIFPMFIKWMKLCKYSLRTLHISSDKIHSLLVLRPPIKVCVI